jgi:hypothetical protein
MLRRRGRPGLVGTMARTAVIAGTATAVSGSVQRRGAERAANDQARQADEQQVPVDPAAAQASATMSQQPAAMTSGDERIAKIRELGQLKEDGLLTDEEFTAAKASLLGI